MSFLISEAVVEGNTASFTFKVPMSLCDYAGVSLGQLLRVLGDISWELVSRLSGTSVYNATRRGNPCYLGFLYIDLHANRLALSDIKLGHEVTVTASVYGDVVQSRHTSLVRLSLAKDHSPVRFDDCASPPPRSICFNIGMIWIARSKDGSNHSMVRSMPDGYSVAAFPAGVAAAQEAAIARHESARTDRLVLDRPPGAFTELCRTRVPYVISQNLDLNGVMLLYFASYPHIYQSALTPLARDAGIDPRRHDEMSLLYFGNANMGEALDIEARLLRETRTGARFLSCSATRVEGGKLIGVCNIRLGAGCVAAS